MKKVLVIGGGISGCVAAHLLSRMGGWDITLIEQAPVLGAGVRTSWYGGHPYTFGPRHFLTQNEKVYHYLNAIVPLRKCNEHQFWTYVEPDRQFYNFPIHVDDINFMPDHKTIWKELAEAGVGPFQEGEFNPAVDPTPDNFEEYWIRSVGQTLYKKFIKQYSTKMWRVPPHRLDTFSWSPKGTPLKQGPRAAWDTALSAYPYGPDGYNRYFDVATAGVNVLLSTKIDTYDFEARQIWFNGVWVEFDVIISTISPDTPFGYSEGKLPFIGRDFHKIVLPIKYALPPDIYFMYEAGDEKWTRLTEFKKFTHHEAEDTLIGIEMPSENGRYYPMPIKKHQELAEEYYKAMAPNIYCLGRNGSYRYSLDIAACIEQAHELVEVLKAGGQDHPVIGAKWRI